MRTTKKNVEGVFALLVKRLADAGYEDASQWRLDYYPYGGGYRIEGPDGHTPLGNTRRKAGEMWSAISFALDVLWAKDYRKA